MRLRVMVTRPNSLNEQDLRGRAVGAQGLIERGHHFVAVAALFHVDEVEDDDAAQIAQANLADDFLHGFEVGLDDGVFEARASRGRRTCRC